MTEDSEQESVEPSKVPNNQERDPPVSADEDSPAKEHLAPESPGTSLAPSTPLKQSSFPNRTENQPPSEASASPGDYNSQPCLTSPPHHAGSAVGPPPQLGSPPHMHYPPPPHPHAYYAYGVMAYPPPPPPTQPHPPPTPPVAAGPVAPNSSNGAIPQQQPQLASPPRNTAPYPPPPPHAYYPIHYAPPPHMHMAPQPYHPYAAQDWSKGRSSASTAGEQQQQQQPPPPPPPPPPHPMPMHPPHMYGWAPVPVAPPMPPGQYVPVPPPGARYPGWGPPPQQPQRAFNHNRKLASGLGMSTISPARKKLLGKSISGNKTRRILESREAASSPTQLASSIRDEIENTGCTCKKTKCLKLYCQCFGIKIYCGPNCRCYSCANTKEHEKQRQEAMRNILSRNPLAFDTKFTDPNTSSSSTADVASAEGARVLAHKLGCKCRKSACMKKYCECYAGSVKCTSACRCIGCKNQGNAYDHGGSGMAMVMTGYHPQHPPRSYSMAQVSQPPSEHWGAAQSLAFLKRGSPASDSKGSRPFTLGVSPVTKASPQGGDLPSLASSSEGTSPDDMARKHMASSTPENAVKQQDDAMLLAAVAMTEFGQSPPPSSVKRSTPSSNESGTPTSSDKMKAKNRSRRNIDFDSPIEQRTSMRTRSSTKKMKRAAV